MRTSLHALAILLAIPTTAPAADWPSFLGPNRDGISTETGIRTAWPAGGPPLVWQMEMGEGYAAPSVADGTLFAFDRVADRARLVAVDSRTGERRWKKEYTVVYEDMYGYSGGPRAVPVIDGDRVYTFGVEGRLRAHQVADGKLLWDVDTTERYGVQKNFFGAGSTPVVLGDLLIVPVGGSPEGSPGIQSGEVKGNGTGIVAFDKVSGEERYRLSDELASYASPVLATIGGKRWGFHFARGGLLAFDPKAGEERFHFPWRAKILESVNAATPVVVGDKIFLTETYGPGSVLLRLGEKGFEVVWKDENQRNQKLASHWATPIYQDGTLYGVTGRGSGDAQLRALDFATGTIHWSEKLPGRSCLLLVDGHLVVLAEYGQLWLVRATPERFVKVAETIPENAQGDKLLRHPAWNAPVLSDGLLYLRGKDRLVALELIPEPASSAP